MTHFAGACLCGGVRFQFRAPSKWCAHCHCSLCRRAHGAGLVTWVGVANDHFELLEGSALLTRYASSADALRSFCSRCGSMLFFTSERWPGETHIARACIPGPIDRVPAAHVFFSDAVDWIHVDDELARYGGPTGTEPLS